MNRIIYKVIRCLWWKIYWGWIHSCYRIRCFFIRRKLTNHNFSLFSNDCTGGVILHRLGERFNAPTVNLFFPSLFEYLTYLEHLDVYSSIQLEDITSSQDKWPIGILKDKEFGDIKIAFMHYKSFVEAKQKWDQRTSRIEFTNIYILLHLNEPNIDLIKAFSNLKYQKILITYPPVYKKIRIAIEKFHIPYFVITSLEASPSGEVMQFYGVTGRKHIDAFDILSFVNRNDS